MEKPIQLAALLHDIGKFWQRAGESGMHQYLSKKFIEDILQPPEGIDKKLLSTLVLRHHDRQDLPVDLRVNGLPKYGIERTLARIVSEADNISAGMDREYDEEGEAEHPLLPIFLDVKLKRNKKTSDNRYYNPVHLGLDGMFSEIGDFSEEKLKRTHLELWKNFEKEVALVQSRDYNSFLNNLYFLLRKYTSFVLSAGYKTKPDISLFDNLKTSAAIANCLYKFVMEENVAVEDRTQENKRYLLIEDDLSGIQDFISQVATPEEARKGMSRRLRGRSFWLNLLMDAVATKIIDELDLPEMNILWNTGGHFLIITPNLEWVKERIEILRSEINKRLFEDYDGKLFIAISTLQCSAKDLKNFWEMKERLARETNRLKRQKFIEILSEDLKFFEPKGENTPIESHCVVCGAYNKNGDAGLCGLCERHEDLGRELAKADYLVRGLNLPEELSSKFKIFEISYFLLTEDKLDAFLSGMQRERIVVYRLNNTNFLDRSSKYPDVSFGFKFIGNTVPLDEEENVLPFEQIAEMSKGAAKLGILKADLDNLGKIFAEGLEKEVQSISRIHTLSSMLELFFAGYLNKICERYYVFSGLCDECKDKSARKIEIRDEKEKTKFIYYEVDENEVCPSCKGKYKKIFKPYVTYSGGDDLLIIGPWDTIIELAGDIRKEFKRFTCENPDMSISAGIAVVDPHYPVARTVMLADGELDLAKSHLKDENGESMKNSIGLFNECVCWDNLPGHQKKGFSDLFELARYLERLCEDGEISKSFIYSLLPMWRRSFGKFGDDLSKIENRRISEHAHVPLLKYQLARIFKDRKKIEEVEGMIKPYMPLIRIPVSWVSLRMR